LKRTNGLPVVARVSSYPLTLPLVAFLIMSWVSVCSGFTQVASVMELVMSRLALSMTRAKSIGATSSTARACEPILPGLTLVAWLISVPWLPKVDESSI
jgi:hypothetical protein